MTKLKDHRSILAIDPGPRGVAFVFFENGTLLDWGTRGRGVKELEVLDAMLVQFEADVLVLEDADASGCERRARLKRVLHQIAERAATRGVSVRKVSRYAVRQSWRERGETNKHDVAAAIGTMFPEIQPYVPRVRRDWDSEDARTGVFDALSLLLDVFDTETDVTEGVTSKGLRACV
jgi:hypothetical protein